MLVLGSFLALNLAGCGGSSGGPGGVLQPTPFPGTTPVAAPGAVTFQLQLVDGSNASGGTVTLSSGSGRTYTAKASSNGRVSLRNIPTGLYTLVFTVVQPTGQNNGQPLTTTRSLTVTSGTNGFALRQGDTGNSNPFTISGRVLLNPAGTTDPDGNSATGNCAAVITPITDALIVTVRDLNATNGNPIIAQVVRPAQAATTPGTQRGLYSISIPYRPRSFQVTVTNSNDAPFAGVSASTSFPQTDTSVINVDVCTNNSTVAPLPVVTQTPIPTAVVAPTTVGTSVATPTPTVVSNPTPIPTVVPTTTPVPPATPIPTNTPIAGGPTIAPAATNTPQGNATAGPTTAMTPRTGFSTRRR